MNTDPKDVISGTTPEVRNAINEILAIEKEYEFTKNLNKSTIREIEEKIKKIIVREAKIQ